MMINDDSFAMVRDCLALCVGRDNAMTLAQIAAACGMTRRDVELVIESHLSRFPFPVVAAGCGVFQPTQPDDLNAYLHNLHSRHRRMQIREATVRRKARATGWAEEAGRFIRAPQLMQQELFA